ncbi:hypothetical protein DFH09DRAFT_1311545 [Mycena vulgaris]|nr:hypothetical protein DFH09DRAFT_1311545 [Mycena vulgaris]
MSSPNFSLSRDSRPSQSPVPRDGPALPSLGETRAYLGAFAAPLIAQGTIRLNTEVRDVAELPRALGGLGCGGNRGGIYDRPVLSATPGIAQLRELHLAHHPRGWRGPSGYEGKRVLVVGKANSGNDIAAQFAPGVAGVYQSNFPGLPSLPDARIARVAAVAKCTVMSTPGGAPAVDARLVDGSTLRGLGAVLYGTGYRPFPDFIRVVPLHHAPNDRAPDVDALELRARRYHLRELPAVHRRGL